MSESVVRHPAQVLDIDLDRVRAYVQSAPALPVEGLVAPNEAVTRDLLGLLARRNFRQLLKAAVRLDDATREDPAARRKLTAIVSALMAAPDGAVTVALTSPEVTSWLAAYEKGGAAQAPEAIDTLVLGLLPELTAYGERDGLSVEVSVDADGGYTLRRSGVRLAFAPDTQTATLRISADGVEGVSQEGWSATEHRLDRLGRSGPFVTSAPSEALDRSVPAQAGLVALDGDGFAAYLETLGTAYDTLDAHCPEWARELDLSIGWIVPVREKGFRANNFSTPAFRGLIAMNARPTYLGAQALAHEAAHNKMTTLLALAPLCSNPEVHVVSPVVEEDRQLNALFHAVVSFAQDIEVTRRLIGQVQELPGVGMQRYLEDRVSVVGDTLDVLTAHADLTEAGYSICEDVAKILSGARTT